MRLLPVLVVGFVSLFCSAASAATTSCSSVAACVMGTNSSSGPGVGGTSKTGFGLSGISTSGHGVNGTSSSSFGVVGITTENATSTSNARSGVLGEDSSTNKKAFNSGVTGTSKYGVGVTGNGYIYGGYFTGALGLFTPGIDVDPDGFVAMGYGTTSGAIRAYGQSGGGSSPVSPEHLFEGTGCLIDPDHETPICNDVAIIYGNGDATFSGTVTQNGDAVLRTKSASGPDVASFGARAAAPSIEDVGKGQLRNGTAYITLDHTFASTIDPHVAYSVFITPEGDSNGVYTSQLSARGFAVRENKAGRSSLVFDYRIVAKPIDAKVMHLPLMSQVAALSKHFTITRRTMKRNR